VSEIGREHEAWAFAVSTPKGGQQPIKVRRIEFRGQSDPDSRELRVALAGNPNSGKTTLFNALTGLRTKVGNYPGVTVEKKEGLLLHGRQTFRLIDLPGTYSLSAASEDERVVRDVLLGVLPSQPPVDLVLLVVDASHLERHLYLATQVLDLGLPVVVALTMNDEARYLGRAVDPSVLSRQLGVPVLEVVAPRGHGVQELKDALGHAIGAVPTALPWRIGDMFLTFIDRLAFQMGQTLAAPLSFRRYIALQMLLESRSEHPLLHLEGVCEMVVEMRRELDASGIRWREAEARGRYDWIRDASRDARAAAGYRATFSDRVDRVLIHPLWGMLIFVAIMAVVFQAVFSWATPFMDAIDAGFSAIAAGLEGALPAGPLQGLLVDGVVAGVGSVVIFLPQILLLFLFIALLEDSGYMARAAFLMNRHMRRVGLHGRSFIPMLSGFACAIPAIMATRVISDPKDRLITMLVVPLTSCSARLPVYALMIAAAVPATAIAGGFTAQGLALWGAYAFSLLAAVAAAYVMRRTVLKGEPQAFILELPPYRLPDWKTVLASMWERGRLFLTQAGTIILCISILLWFLASFPVDRAAAGAFEMQRSQARASAADEALLGTQLAAIDNEEAGQKLRTSFAGRLGRLIEPAIAPLGFDWKIGIGLIGSFAAREVFVSTMAVVYNVGDADETSGSLLDALKKDINPRTGKPVFSLIVAINLMLFFILACQCMSTVAVVKRETASWKWPLFMVGYMTALAYVVCLVFYQVASRLWPGSA
jgi:ferrous iron transport protein B